MHKQNTQASDIIYTIIGTVWGHPSPRPPHTHHLHMYVYNFESLSW